MRVDVARYEKLHPVVIDLDDEANFTLSHHLAIGIDRIRRAREYLPGLEDRRPHRCQDVLKRLRVPIVVIHVSPPIDGVIDVRAVEPPLGVRRSASAA